MPPDLKVYRFATADRLRRPAEFKRAFSGRRVSAGVFTASAVPAEAARLGLAIPARLVPRSVDRNRLKRQIRESFRQRRATLPALDIVVGVRAGAARSEALANREALALLWRRLGASE